MLAIISTLKSGVMHGLLVSLVAMAIEASGLAEQFPNAEGYVDGGLKVIEALGLLYAAYSRKFKPNPPLSETAVTKTLEKVEDGTLKTIS